MAIATAYLIPKKGVTVRDPVTSKPLPAQGATKPLSAFWLRRIKAGSVIEGEAPASGEAVPVVIGTVAAAAPKRRPTTASEAADRNTTKGEAK